MTHYFPDLGDDEPYYDKPRYDGTYDQPLIDDDLRSGIDRLLDDHEKLLEAEEKYHRDADYHYYLNID